MGYIFVLGPRDVGGLAFAIGFAVSVLVILAGISIYEWNQKRKWKRNLDRKHFE